MARVSGGVDPEIRALGTVTAALDGLDVAARRRVLAYACERYEDDDAEPEETPAPVYGTPPGGYAAQ